MEETVEKPLENNAQSGTDSNADSSTADASSNAESNPDLLEFGVPKIDDFFAENELKPITKRKFKETALIHGIVYKFAHFGVEITKDQATIFGKYKSEFFDIEAYENNDKLLEELLPRIQEHFHNPVLTKHPIIRYFSKFKK